MTSREKSGRGLGRWMEAKRLISVYTELHENLETNVAASVLSIRSLGLHVLENGCQVLSGLMLQKVSNSTMQ